MADLKGEIAVIVMWRFGGRQAVGWEERGAGAGAQRRRREGDALWSL